METFGKSSRPRTLTSGGIANPGFEAGASSHITKRYCYGQTLDSLFLHEMLYEKRFDSGSRIAAVVMTFGSGLQRSVLASPASSPSWSSGLPWPVEASRSFRPT